jgi:hypothetical protein
VRPLLRAIALHGAILSGYLIEPVMATLACAYHGDGHLRTTALGLLHAARTLVPNPHPNPTSHPNPNPP